MQQRQAATGPGGIRFGPQPWIRSAWRALHVGGRAFVVKHCIGFKRVELRRIFGQASGDVSTWKCHHRIRTSPCLTNSLSTIFHLFLSLHSPTRGIITPAISLLLSLLLSRYTCGHEPGVFVLDQSLVT